MDITSRYNKLLNTMPKSKSKSTNFLKDSRYTRGQIIKYKAQAFEYTSIHDKYIILEATYVKQIDKDHYLVENHYNKEIKAIYIDSIVP